MKYKKILGILSFSSLVCLHSITTFAESKTHIFKSYTQGEFPKVIEVKISESKGSLFKIERKDYEIQKGEMKLIFEDQLGNQFKCSFSSSDTNIFCKQDERELLGLYQDLRISLGEDKFYTIKRTLKFVDSMTGETRYESDLLGEKFNTNFQR